MKGYTKLAFARNIRTVRDKKSKCCEAVNQVSKIEKPEMSLNHS